MNASVLRSLSFVALGTLPGLLLAQISFGGRPLGLKAEKLGLPNAPVAEMPAVNAAQLMQEDAERAATGEKGPFRFGYNHSVDLGTDNSGVWRTLSDGTRVWRLSIHCPEAYSINFVFGEYHVPDGGRVFVYGRSGEVLGGLTAESAAGRHQLGVTQLAGDRITVEYDEPASVAGQGLLRITQVTHAYRDILGADLAKALGDSGPCNNNVVCPEGDPWRDQIASVAMITVGGDGLCTGQLLNDCASDGTPYFLTANHCTGGENPATWIFRFKWESPTCTPTTNGPTNKTVSGAQLLLHNTVSDFALLQLNSTPPADYAVYYTGWDATGNTPQDQTCIHHPSGDIKKISFDYDPASATDWGTPSAAVWHIGAWDDGTTEPGSSGSGLWDQDHHLIGQLYGGQADCSNDVNDYFGRFAVSYPYLQQWLGSCSQVIDGFDPNATTHQLDASLFSVSGIDARYCNENTISPVITLKNVGTTTLTQIGYTYDVDGNSPGSGTWTGSLATGATTNVTLPAITVGNGAHTFHASCSSPNGGADENPANDSRSRAFTVVTPGTTITLNITLDDYGSETSWRVRAAGGATEYTGGPYADGLDQTVEHEPMCLSAGCYTITFYDAYGDGFCCDYGNGDFNVTGPNSEVLLDGNANFGDSATFNFCVTANQVRELDGTALRVFPNPSNGRLTVDLPQGLEEATLVLEDAVGREVRRLIVNGAGRHDLDLGDLPQGSYLLEARFAGGRHLSKLLIAR